LIDSKIFEDGVGKTYRYILKDDVDDMIKSNTIWNENTKLFIDKINDSDLMEYFNRDYCLGGNLLLYFDIDIEIDEGSLEYLDSMGAECGFDRIPMDYECGECGQVYEEGSPCHPNK